MDKTNTKPWYLSKGVMGSLGALIAGVLGIWYGGITADDITPILIGLTGSVSAFLALIGRVTASSKIE